MVNSQSDQLQLDLIQLCSVGKALHQYRRVYGFESHSGLNFFLRLSFQSCIHTGVYISVMINNVFTDNDDKKSSKHRSILISLLFILKCFAKPFNYKLLLLLLLYPPTMNNNLFHDNTLILSYVFP